MTEKALKWTRFGWQDISADVPEHWALGTVQGDWHSGYFRIDDENAARLEVRWEQAEQDYSPNRVVKRYLRQIEKGLKKDSRTVRISSPCPAIDRLGVFDGRKGVSFSWDGDSPVWGAIWRCESCNRILVLQLRLKEAEGQEVAPRILRSLEDHPGAGTSLWAIYGLRCRVPTSYRLIDYSLTAGFLQLCFASRESPRRQLDISRWGPAGILLKETELGQWWAGYLLSRKQGCVSAERDGEIRSHACMTASGKVKGGFSPRGKGGFLKLRPWSPIRWRGKAWHCPQSNRIYAVRSTDHPGALELVDRVAEEGICHEVS